MTPPQPRPRRAAASDKPQVRALLQQAGLPLDGLDGVADLFVVDDGDAVVGAIGFERHGSLGLLRSLVVAPSRRGRGLGVALLAFGVARMRAEGLREAYGLTTTIPDLLLRLGWGEVPRAAMPEGLNSSMELRGACPDSARAFRLSLAAPGPW